MKAEFFMASSCAKGYVNLFPSLMRESGMHICILKGTAGSGKSSMMKRIAKRLSDSGEFVELIHCSSDPYSLDGVICRRKGFAIVDGTNPHPLEPAYPIVGQSIISLFECIDKNKVQTGEIEELFDRCSALHARAGRFVSTAASILDDIILSTERNIDREKLERYFSGLVADTIPRKSVDGSTSVRFQGTVTSLGICDFASANLESCKNKRIISDSIGAVSSAAMKLIADSAVEKGYDIIVCKNPLSADDRIQSVIVPELSLGFASSGFGQIKSDGVRIIHEQRFLKTPPSAQDLSRAAFAKKVSSSLLCEASSLMSQAKLIHDEIEKIYIPAVNFNMISEIEKNIISSFNL